MTLGVIIIAHNEENGIAKCLRSVIFQTRKADGIWLIAHNCTDKTVEIARAYPEVQIVEYNSPAGIVYARTKAFEVASTDLIASIDGDSWADTDWLDGLFKVISKNGVSGAGGAVIFTNSVKARLLSYNFFFIQRLFRPARQFYFWGSNYICRREDFFRVGGIQDLLELKNKIGLRYAAEDLYLALKLKKLGKVVFAPGAVVYSVAKQTENSENRGYLNRQDKIKLFRYFGVIR